MDNPEEYYCAISRFSCPTNVIPVFVPTFQPSSFTNTIYSVTLTYNGNTSQTFLIYVPTSGYPTTSEFYPYVYNYQDFVDMINTAMATSFSAISPPFGSQAPYMQFDPVTSLFSLVAQIAYYDSSAAMPINVYFNQPLSVLLEGLDVKVAPNGSIPDPQGEDVLVRIHDTKNNWYNPSWVTPSTPPLYYIMMQNYSSLLVLTPFISLRLISNTIPIKKEYIVSQNLDTQLSGVGVLQTFIPLFTESMGHATQLTYDPSVLRLLNMAGHQSIQKIDFQFQWIDGSGMAHPVYISYNQVCSVSFAFLKKNTFTS